jgi:hypothetical protein
MRAISLLPIFFAIPSLATLQYVDFPHLIIPLNSNKPDTALGTQHSGQVSNQVHTEISFDVRADIPAAICRINFHLNLNPTKNAPWTLYGNPPYEVKVTRLRPTINKDKDTWNSRPATTGYVATIRLQSDGSVQVQDGWFDCPKGNVAQFLLTPANGNGMGLTWFELDYSAAEGGPHGITLEMHS